MEPLAGRAQSRSFGRTTLPLHRSVALRLVLVASSGSLLFLSDHPVHAWALQIVALLPWLWVLATAGSPQEPVAAGSANPSGKPLPSRPLWLDSALAGFVLALFYCTPLLVVIRLPWLMGLTLGAYISVIWVGLSVAVAYVLRGPGVSSAFAAGAAATVAQWVTVHAIPAWGSAQSFVRVWSAAPWAVQFVDLTGMLGIAFVLVTSQALVVRLALRTPRPRDHAIALAVLVTCVVAYDLVRWNERPTSQVRVAAVGWLHEQLPRGRETPDQDIVQHMLLPLLMAAAEQRPVLIVSPETGFHVEGANREALFAPLVELAKTRRVALAIGYFDETRDDNRIAFIDSTGAVHAEYRKTHLIWLLEHYEPGDGTLVSWSIDGARVGGMICQDDNFTDIASGYAREGFPIVAVPTNDWHAVKDQHFDSSRMRTLENRYAIVRAATNGLSAIVSARGELLGARDHFDSGPGVVVADLPLFRGGSVHAWARHAFALLCAVGLLLAAWRSGARGRRTRDHPGPRDAR